MSNLLILNRLECSLFLLTLKSKTNKSRKVEAYNKLKKIYPSNFSMKDIVLIRNKASNSFLCYLKIDIDVGAVLISPELFVLNHYKKYTGNILINTVKFCEIIEVENGKILKINLKPKLLLEDEKNGVLITEQILKNKSNKKDCFYKRSKKQIFSKILFSLIIFSLFFTIGVFFTKYNLEKYQSKLLDQKRIEENNKLKLEKQKEIANDLKEKKSDYYELCVDKYPKIYNLVNLIYNNIGSKSIIESLNIEKKNFNLEIITTDSMKILSNFENDNNINQIQMTKTSVQKNKEYVTYIGKFNPQIIYPDNDCEPEEQIIFYDTNIIEEKDRLEKMKHVKLSSYADNLRDILHENNCLESYLQYRKNKNIAILECFFKASSSDVMNFLKNIQNNNMIDVYSINFQNLNNNNLEVLIKFYTGIDVSENLEDFTENFSNEKEVMPNELSLVFRKSSGEKETVKKSSTPITKNVYKKESNNEQKKIIPERKTILKNRNLSYVGKVKVGDLLNIVIKNKEDDRLYNLPVVNDLYSTNNDCCIIQDKNKFLLKIDNNLYEVNK